MTERLSASSAAKHLGCHASANLELAIPGYTPPDDDGNTKASVKGTDMHELLEKIGEYTPKEMLGIAEAIAYVATLRRTRRFKQILEAPGEGWWLQSKPSTKADAVFYVSDQLDVVDFKFGKIPVLAAGNKQGMYYALAFLPLAPKAKGVTFHIVQPFADNIDSVFFTIDELEQFRLDTIAAEKKIRAGSVEFNPGDHCQFCPANPHSRGAKGKPYCPAMLKLLYPHSQPDEDAILAMI